MLVLMTDQNLFYIIIPKPGEYLPNEIIPLEEIEVALDIPHEGEIEKGTLQSGSDSKKKKHAKKQIDYWYLDDPYWDKDDLFMENNQEFYEMFTSDPNDEPSNLKDHQNGCNGKCHQMMKFLYQINLYLKKSETKHYQI